jgi:hypothetical protein
LPFNDKYNTDDVLLRCIAIGLLDFLNKKVYITQVVSDEDVRQIPVPFFYAMYGSERFLQDFYINYQSNCDGPTFTEGNTDPVPRGVINLTAMTINTAALTNKFNRGTYNKEVDGSIQAFSAFLNVIPLTLTYDVEILSNTLVEAYKIIQETIATFYKAATFAVDYKGMRIPLQVGFSQDYAIEKPITFTYGDDTSKAISIKFTLEMEAYQPVLDATTEMFRGKTMHHGIGNEMFSYSGVSGVFAKLSVDVDPQMTDIKNETDANGNPVEPGISGINGPPPPQIPA